MSPSEPSILEPNSTNSPLDCEPKWIPVGGELTANQIEAMTVLLNTITAEKRMWDKSWYELYQHTPTSRKGPTGGGDSGTADWTAKTMCNWYFSDLDEGFRGANPELTAEMSKFRESLKDEKDLSIIR